MSVANAAAVPVEPHAARRHDLFTSGGGRIEVENISKRYSGEAGEVQALSGVSLTIEPGTSLAIMGRSGCGKTTLLNMIGGIDHPTAGRIGYDGMEVTKLSQRELERYRLHRVGFVFQLFNLIPSLTALGNVMLPMVLADVPLARRQERATALLELVGIGHKMNKFPDQLSGGEQQRVAITVALANDPAVLLADEPTGNLDAKNAASVADLLCSLARDFGKTVIIVSHDPHIAPRADRTLTMEDGNFLGA
jgi:putative ABC transport system ATP-binding protein